MNSFKKDLKALAKKHKLELLDECNFCGHEKECTDGGTCYYFTVIEKKKDKANASKTTKHTW